MRDRKSSCSLYYLVAPEHLNHTCVGGIDSTSEDWT